MGGVLDNYTYDPLRGTANLMLDNSINGGWSRFMRPEKASWNNMFGLFGNDTVVQDFGIHGGELLRKIGFSDLRNDKGFQQYLFNQGIASVGANGGLNIKSGLDANAIQALEKSYTDGLANGSIVNGTSVNQNSNSLFGTGTDRYGNTTWGGGTALQWLGAGLGTASSLYGMYNAHKSMKLARQNFEEQKALNRANFKMQAKSYNNSLRNQMSGRSFTGMSGAAQRMLGRDYNARKAEETY